MFDPSVIITLFLASAVVAVVPGPNVSLIVANALRKGTAAGLANVAGTQIGVLTMIGVLALGLEAVVSFMGEAFVYLKLAGAAYLVYLGYKLLRSDGVIETSAGSNRSLTGYMVQGFLVLWSNPKALLFFGAFIPPFVNPAYDASLQVMVYGGVFLVTATVLDSGYAILAGRAGRLLSRQRVRIAEKIGGSVLIAGGLGLALTRR
ncbi:LysE family translocator [Acuticoccus sp. MNP-M23]|uniref:LysE family translocator n=1 Tax=Acuticoccus sp. MNP-M23 TaxID=3072793 RepID=UPI0028153C9C|nr:LysE family translocator [Acuticoccus sp. MNP-M23]WMS43214.1 LysE family translocator [Acuticoccus sp. MNP-M23]